MNAAVEGREADDLALLQLKIDVNDTWLDYFVIGVYFLFVLGIGALLRTRMQTSKDYFLSGRSLPSWGPTWGLWRSWG